MQPSVRGFIAALLLTLAVSSSARADMGTPGIERAKPTHQITTSESFPDHVFVVFRPKGSYEKDEKTGEVKWQSANEAEYVELTSEHPLVIVATKYWRDTTSLLIVSRTLAAPYRTALELAEAVEAKKVPAAFQHQFPHREDVPEWYGKEITINYRLQRTADGGIEIVRTTWGPGYQCCLACLSPFGLLLGGMWLIRRRRRRKVPPL